MEKGSFVQHFTIIFPNFALEIPPIHLAKAEEFPRLQSQGFLHAAGELLDAAVISMRLADDFGSTEMRGFT